MKGGTPNTVYLKDYQAPDYLIDSIDLVFELDDHATRVSASLKIRRNHDGDRPLVLHGQDLKLLEVRLDGKVLTEDRYSLAEEEMTVHESRDEFVLETVVEIDPANNTSLEGLYQSSGNFCTQCEAEGFRKITYYLDRPDIMALFSTTIIADSDSYPAMLSNGNLVEQGETEDGRSFVKWVDPFRKPAYLFALVAGKLEYMEDHYKTTSGRDVVLRIYVEPENIDKCEHAMRSLKKSMAWDEEVFGLEYDLDIYMIVAVNDFNMGAMENKGLNVFNSKYILARPETATDQDYLGIESVVAHEYFHNWTGNRVTCRDWFQLSLKEGLTVFRDQEFSSDMNSRAVIRIMEVRVLRGHQFLEDASPMAHPVRPDSYVEINNFYTATVYNKGAEVVRMYHTLLGKDGFRKGMDLYFERHDGQAVTTDDFFAAMADANNEKLEFFRRWYEQAGTPVLKAESVYDAAAQTLTLKLSQSCPATPGQEDKQPFLIPVGVGMLDEQGNSLPLDCDSPGADAEESAKGKTEVVLRFVESETKYVFRQVSSKPVVSLLRGFSAPVKLQYERDESELAFLLAHDVDAFNRWEAGQTLALNIYLALISAFQKNEEPPAGTLYLEALKKVLERADDDPALAAEILTLPACSYVSEQLEEIDVDAVDAASRHFRKMIASALEEQLHQTWRRYHRDDEWSIEAGEIGKRKLKNLCLSYLCELEDPAYIQLANKQYESATNMTDSLAALSIFANLDTDQSLRVLDDFYRRWQHDTLVMDKWLSVQAASILPGTIDKVKELLNHPVFELTNPNKVRALLGVFMRGNQAGFHARDGSGYDLLLEYVTRLDRINPQSASALLDALTRWRRYDSKRRELMQKVLEQVVAIDGLSKDCYEIASKSLQ